MRTPTAKTAASTPASANLVACRGQVTRPRREKLNPYRARAFQYTGLARLGSFYC
jgi:hypothetical protein